jgi:hypothetical protein
MKSIICGSRELCGFQRSKDPELWDEHAAIFCKIMDECPFIDEITEIVSGCARGVDTLGNIVSLMRFGKKATPFPADWEKYKKAAGPIRNQQMLDYCLTSDSVIAILRYNSRGTKDMIERATKKGLRVYSTLVEFQSYEEKHGSRP